MFSPGIRIRVVFCGRRITNDGAVPDTLTHFSLEEKGFPELIIFRLLGAVGERRSNG